MAGKTFSLFGSQVAGADARRAAEAQMRVWLAEQYPEPTEGEGMTVD